MQQGANLMMEKSLFHLEGEHMRVELDKKSLFALASDTRLEILHALQPMRRTVSQLSEALNIDKAAVFRHLKKMEEGGLVKRYEDHGFVYYGLSWKARDLLSPNENTRIVVLLSASWVLCIIIAFFIVAALLASTTGIMFEGERLVPADQGTGTYGGDNNTGQMERFLMSVEADPLSWIIFGVPIALCIGGAAYLGVSGYQTLRKPKQISKTKAEPAKATEPMRDDDD